jgi:hypothetical protein
MPTVYTQKQQNKMPFHGGHILILLYAKFFILSLHFSGLLRFLRFFATLYFSVTE